MATSYHVSSADLNSEFHFLRSLVQVKAPVAPVQVAPEMKIPPAKQPPLDKYKDTSV